MREVKLPSGAVLKITPSPFGVAKALYQTLLRELKHIPILGKTEMASVYKDLFCAGFSSPDVEAKLWECFKRCTYNSGAGDFKIEEATFEPVAARDDYMMVCIEVAKENVLPFAKSLYAEFDKSLTTTQSDPK